MFRIDVITISLINLSQTSPLFTLDESEDVKFYHKQEIMDWIEDNWGRLWLRPIDLPWIGYGSDSKLIPLAASLPA
jgi:hypothetical protein